MTALPICVSNTILVCGSGMTKMYFGEALGALGSLGGPKGLRLYGGIICVWHLNGCFVE